MVASKQALKSLKNKVIIFVKRPGIRCNCEIINKAVFADEMKIYDTGHFISDKEDIVRKVIRMDCASR